MDNAVSEDTTDDSEDTDQTDDAGKYKFGFSVIDMQNPYFITLEEAVQQVVDKEECTMVVKDPSSDADTQAEQIQEMIDEGINAIFLCPVDWEKITPSLQALQEAGVKIINIDSQVKDTDYIDAYVGSNNSEAGKLCGNDLIEKYPDGGTVAILEATKQNSINDRITGFEQTIAKAEKGFEVVAREDTNGTFDSALEAAKKILNEQPDITAIMCGNDQMAVAAKTALNLAGNDQTVVYSIDGSPDIKKELKKADGQIAGTVAQSPVNIGKKAVDIALDILEGKHTADSGTECMDRTASISIQKGTGFFGSGHFQIRKNDTVYNIKFQRAGQQFVYRFGKIGGKPVYIQWIKDDGISHAMTTGRAAITSFTVCLGHVIAAI